MFSIMSLYSMQNLVEKDEVIPERSNFPVDRKILTID
jgi:hypothetical protein